MGGALLWLLMATIRTLTWHLVCPAAATASVFASTNSLIVHNCWQRHEQVSPFTHTQCVVPCFNCLTPSITFISPVMWQRQMPSCAHLKVEQQIILHTYHLHHSGLWSGYRCLHDWCNTHDTLMYWCNMIHEVDDCHVHVLCKGWQCWRCAGRFGSCSCVCWWPLKVSQHSEHLFSVACRSFTYLLRAPFYTYMVYTSLNLFRVHRQVGGDENRHKQVAWKTRAWSALLVSNNQSAFQHRTLDSLILSWRWCSRTAAR